MQKTNKKHQKEVTKRISANLWTLEKCSKNSKQLILFTNETKAVLINTTFLGKRNNGLQHFVFVNKEIEDSKLIEEINTFGEEHLGIENHYKDDFYRLLKSYTKGFIMDTTDGETLNGNLVWLIREE